MAQSSRKHENDGKEKDKEKELCEHCHEKEKYRQSMWDKPLPYCSKSCADAAAVKAAPEKVCQYPNCSKPRSSGWAGYCSSFHAKADKKPEILCLDCSIRPTVPAELRCATCKYKYRKPEGTPVLHDLSNRDPLYRQVNALFVKSWNGPQPGVVEKIYAVAYPSPKSQDKSSKENAPADDPNAKNEGHPVYYSSQCVCDLGTQDRVEVCFIPSCGICSALRSKFETLACLTTESTGKLGTGLYLARTSSTANLEATSCTSSPYKVAIFAILSQEGFIEVGPTEQVPTEGFRSITDGDLVMVKDRSAVTSKAVVLYT